MQKSIEDAGGNTVSTDTNAITLGIAAGSGTLSGCTSTTSGGVADFSGCSINAVGEHTLRANDVTDAQSAPSDEFEVTWRAPRSRFPRGGPLVGSGPVSWTFMPGFVDQAQLHARAGDGGAGAVSWRREAHVDRGGPDGGDGGHGGDVWLVASVNEASLLGFRDHPFRRATDGVHGSGSKRHGARGKDLVVPVPVGTVVRERTGAVVCDLNVEGARFRVAEGGQGGRGNARFLSNRRRAPAFAEQAEKGQEFWLDMELKLMADVALVGFPNAGKSTLISAVSAAKPKIADYPFTTLEPHLGVVRVGGVRDGTEFVMADIPGLVEGAAEGKGLGHQFLRHIERARVSGGPPRPRRARGRRRVSSGATAHPAVGARLVPTRASGAPDNRGGEQG